MINLLLAAFIFAVIAYAYGYPAGRPIVTNVIAGSPAATAGLVPGDEITSFNGSRIIMAADVRQHIMIQPNKAVEIEILRGNAARKLTATLSEQTVQDDRSEEHTSELQSLMRISYAVFCLKKKKKHNKQ